MLMPHFARKSLAGASCWLRSQSLRGENCFQGTEAGFEEADAFAWVKSLLLAFEQGLLGRRRAHVGHLQYSLFGQTA